MSLRLETEKERIEHHRRRQLRFLNHRLEGMVRTFCDVLGANSAVDECIRRARLIEFWSGWSQPVRRAAFLAVDSWLTDRQTDIRTGRK